MWVNLEVRAPFPKSQSSGRQSATGRGCRKYTVILFEVLADVVAHTILQGTDTAKSTGWNFMVFCKVRHAVSCVPCLISYSRSDPAD